MAGLHALLAKPLLQLTRDFERDDDVRSTRSSLLVWSNLLRVVDEEGVLRREAHRRARISRRAFRGMPQFCRWVVADPATDGRSTRLHLTEDGLRALRAGRARLDALETEWRARFGDSAVDALDAVLRTE